MGLVRLMSSGLIVPLTGPSPAIRESTTTPGLKDTRAVSGLLGASEYSAASAIRPMVRPSGVRISSWTSPQCAAIRARGSPSEPWNTNPRVHRSPSGLAGWLSGCRVTPLARWTVGVPSECTTITSLPGVTAMGAACAMAGAIAAAAMSAAAVSAVPASFLSMHRRVVPKTGVGNISASSRVESGGIKRLGDRRFIKRDCVQIILRISSSGAYVSRNSVH